MLQRQTSRRYLILSFALMTISLLICATLTGSPRLGKPARTVMSVAVSTCPPKTKASVMSYIAISISYKGWTRYALTWWPTESGPTVTWPFSASRTRDPPPKPIE